MSLEHILFKDPWVNYNNNFIRSRLVLHYPQNVVFTVQLLNHVTKSNVYKKYPYADQMDVTTFQNVNWKNTFIVFNHDLQVIQAPEPVLRLISLDRRLHFQKAPSIIFGPFRWSYIELFRYQWLGIVVIVMCHLLWWMLTRYSKNFVLVSRRKPNVPKLPYP